MSDRSDLDVLLIAGTKAQESATIEMIQRIVDAISEMGHAVQWASSLAGGKAFLEDEAGYGCILLDWDLPGGETVEARAAIDVVRAVRRRNRDIPIFLMAGRTQLQEIPLEVVEQVGEYVWLFEDTPQFVAGRVDYAIRRYNDAIVPPFFAELMKFTREHEYSWHTPGHTGGTAFLKSAVGRLYHKFYGPTLLRSDLSVSVGELGSLLDHSGAIGEAERNAARTFGADATFFVLNGTSTSNQIVGHSCIVPGEVVAADRNCHKSLNYSLCMTGAVPIYLMPTRNGYGIIGPIPPAALTREAVERTVAASPLAAKAESRALVYSVVTNSTYDGLCYDACQVVELLSQSVDRIHFDEAWYGYARFNPLYAGRYGMSDAIGGDAPTIYSTQSTHKLLAALSQASMIHIRSSDRAPVDLARFNEAYMMHGSTSPLYPMIASCEVAAAMMDGPSGRALTDESIAESITFRKAMVSIGRKLIAEEGSPEWFFGVWQPDRVADPASGDEVDFVDLPDEVLQTRPECWVLHPKACWHGFDELEDGYCMLDPIKVTVTTPGIDAHGQIADMGIPAPIVSAFLDSRRITVEKTGDYVILFLFSMGITKGKWGTLMEALIEFKHLYDRDARLEEAIPTLVNAHPDRYRGMTLRDLCDQMHAEMCERRAAALLDGAFGSLPEPSITPAETYHRLVRGEVERVPVVEAQERVVAVMVVPYPPGIPVLMPGERTGPEDGPILKYLLALEDLDRCFPGFEHDIHGVEVDADGTYHTLCLVEQSRD